MDELVDDLLDEYREWIKYMIGDPYTESFNLCRLLNSLTAALG